MKKLLTLIFSFITLIILFSSCGGVLNNPPSVPNLLFPMNNLTAVPLNLTFRWTESEDPEGKAVTYDLYVGENEDNLQKIAENLDTTSYSTNLAEEGKKYCWKVVAKDEDGAQSESATACFITWSPDFMSIYVVEYNSGPAVEGATVTISDGVNEFIALTNDKGVVQFDPDDFGDAVNVVVSKNEYSISRVSGLKPENSKTYEIIMKKANLNSDPGSQEFPEVNVEFMDMAGNPLDITQPIGDDFKVRITVDSTNQVHIIYAALGKVPGAGFFGDRCYVPDATVATCDISIKGFSGETDFHVVVYDYNDNRVDKVFYLNILGQQADEVKIFQPMKWSTIGDYVNLEAVTRNDGVEFYVNDPILESKNYKLLKKMGKMKPLAAPENCNLWVNVWWIDYNTAVDEGLIDPASYDMPDGYNIYRSFDGIKYEKIGFVKQDAINPTTEFIDKSALLEPGKKVWYKVSSVYGDLESTPVDLGSVVPLDTFDVILVNPKDGDTNVSRNPVFKWRPNKSLESPEGTVTYRYAIWLYNLVQSNEHIFPADPDTWYPFIFASEEPITMSATFTGNATETTLGYIWLVLNPDYMFMYNYFFDKLEPNKTYEWGMDLAYARVWDDSDNSLAVSIAVDYGYGVDPFGNPASLFADFTTGSK